MRNNVKYLTEAALMTALVSVFVLISYYFGGSLESFLFFILPLPLIIYSKKYGFKKSLIPLIATLIITCLINPLNGLCYVLPAGILGIIYGSFLTDKSYSVRITACMMASFLVQILTMIIFADLFDYNIVDEVKIIADTFIKLFHINVNEQSYNLILYNLIPAFVFILAVLEGFLINYSASFVLFRLREVPTFNVDIFKFKVPVLITVFYIATVAVFFSTLKIYPDSHGFIFYLLTLNSNLFFILSFLLVLQGFLFIEILLLSKFKKKTILFMILIMILVIIFPPLLIVVLLMGVYYSIFYRR